VGSEAALAYGLMDGQANARWDMGCAGRLLGPGAEARLAPRLDENRWPHAIRQTGHCFSEKKIASKNHWHERIRRVAAVGQLLCQRMRCDNLVASVW